MGFSKMKCEWFWFYFVFPFLLLKIFKPKTITSTWTQAVRQKKIRFYVFPDMMISGQKFFFWLGCFIRLLFPGSFCDVASHSLYSFEKLRSLFESFFASLVNSRFSEIILISLLIVLLSKECWVFMFCQFSSIVNLIFVEIQDSASAIILWISEYSQISMKKIIFVCDTIDCFLNVNSCLSWYFHSHLRSIKNQFGIQLSRTPTAQGLLNRRTETCCNYEEVRWEGMSQSQWTPTWPNLRVPNRPASTRDPWASPRYSPTLFQRARSKSWDQVEEYATIIIYFYSALYPFKEKCPTIAVTFFYSALF